MVARKRRSRCSGVQSSSLCLSLVFFFFGFGGLLGSRGVTKLYICRSHVRSSRSRSRSRSLARAKYAGVALQNAQSAHQESAAELPRALPHALCGAKKCARPHGATTQLPIGSQALLAARRMQSSLCNLFYPARLAAHLLVATRTAAGLVCVCMCVCVCVSSIYGSASFVSRLPMRDVKGLGGVEREALRGPRGPCNGSCEWEL